MVGHSSSVKMLKQDAILCFFSPCIEQVQRSCETLKLDFKDMRTFEVLLRTYEVREGKMDYGQSDEGVPFRSPPHKRRQHLSKGNNIEKNSISINAWYGPAGTVTPLHHDPHHNIA